MYSFFAFVQPAGRNEKNQLTDTHINKMLMQGSFLLYLCILTEGIPPPRQNTQIYACSHWLQELIKYWFSSRTVRTASVDQTEICLVPVKPAEIWFVCPGVNTNCFSSQTSYSIQDIKQKQVQQTHKL